MAGRAPDGRLRIPVVATLPAEAAAAGIGMDVARFNIDLQIDQPPVALPASGLRFGDLIAVLDQDHRFGRRFAPSWLVVGAIAHGHSIGGGHGLGMVSLLSGPAERIALERSPAATLHDLLRLPWQA